MTDEAQETTAEEPQADEAVAEVPEYEAPAEPEEGVSAGVDPTDVIEHGEVDSEAAKE
jgi:hypothetical protein